MNSNIVIHRLYPNCIIRFIPQTIPTVEINFKNKYIMQFTVNEPGALLLSLRDNLTEYETQKVYKDVIETFKQITYVKET